MWQKVGAGTPLWLSALVPALHTLLANTHLLPKSITEDVFC